jgi:hypothetical protein
MDASTELVGTLREGPLTDTAVSEAALGCSGVDVLTLR